jgi:hypothetical protein
MNELWQWIRPSWMRAWIIVVSSPAFWVLWIVLEGSAAKAILLAAAIGWLFATYRLWFWNTGHRLAVK